MIPLKDTVRSRSFPWVTWLIVILDALVFFYELSLSPGALNNFIDQYGLVPARVSLANPLTWGPMFSSMFIHAGWLHIIGNLWVLIIFGDNVEDRLGAFRYIIFYILSGLAAGIMQVVIDPTSQVPSIGASGAIAGVLGAYFSFYPGARVLTIIPIFILPWIVEIPAWIFLGFWFVSQLFSGVASIGAQNAGGIAWWAHIGGFLFGLVAGRIFAIRRRPSQWHQDQYWPW